MKPGELASVAPEGLWPRERSGPTEAWLEKARAGDAFDRVMLAHQQRVYRTALGLLGRREPALDATQEVFLRLYKYLPRYDAERPLAPWLYRMTVNVCRDQARKESRHNLLRKALPRRGAGPDASGAVESAEWIREALMILAVKERTALVLRDIEGLSTKEVAEVLGSTETTVRSQISRARLKMRRWREKHE